MVDRYSGRAIRATLLAAAAVGGYQLLGSLVVFVARVADPRFGVIPTVWDLGAIAVAYAVALGVGMSWLLLPPVVPGSTLRRLFVASAVAAIVAAVLPAVAAAGINVAAGLEGAVGYGIEDLVSATALELPLDISTGAVRLFPAVALAALGLREWFRRTERSALDPE